MISYEYRLAWYYDCAAEASYMQKNFGFRFWDEDGACCFPYETAPDEAGRFYVNGWSMEELNPKTGDIVLQESAGDKDWSRLGYWEDISCHDQDIVASTKVLSRNGKAFIWPHYLPIDAKQDAPHAE